MADSNCRDARTRIHETAGELYQFAALIMGDETQAIELVETAVAQTQIDPCAEADASMHAARQTLVKSALARLSQRDPKAFDAPMLTGEASGHCIDDDLSSLGISTSQLASMVNGSERGRLREWLNKLPVAQRAIFVERAILGWDNAAAAASLSTASSRNWQAGQVSELFHQALCSLATSLLHAAAQA